MTDAAWAALAAMVASFCSLLGAVFARQALNQSSENGRKIDDHEDASAERGRVLRAEVSPGRRDLND